MHTQHTTPSAGQSLPNAGGNYRSDQPRILTAHFAHELAAANYAQRTQRCPWLQFHPAVMTQSKSSKGMPSESRYEAARARPAK